MRMLALILLVMCVVAAPAYATFHWVKKPTKPWSGNAQLGGIIRTGNTESVNLNGKFNLTYTHGDWIHVGQVQGQFSSSDAIASAQHFYISEQSQYNFSVRNSMFGTTDVTLDRFSPYEYVWVLAAGYGRRVYQKHNLSIDLQSGPGARLSETKENNFTRTEVILYNVGTLIWQITPTSEFEQVLNLQIGDYSTYTQSITSLQTTVIGNLGMQASFSADYNSKLPPDSVNNRHFDTTTDIALVYSF